MRAARILVDGAPWEIFGGVSRSKSSESSRANFKLAGQGSSASSYVMLSYGATRSSSSTNRRS